MYLEAKLRGVDIYLADNDVFQELYLDNQGNFNPILTKDLLQHSLRIIITLRQILSSTRLLLLLRLPSLDPYPFSVPLRPLVGVAS